MFISIPTNNLLHNFNFKSKSSSLVNLHPTTTVSNNSTNQTMIQNAFLENIQLKQHRFYCESKIEQIAKKIAKGEVLTADEEVYINSKNPHLKQEAIRAREEAKRIQTSLDNAQSSGQRSAILSSATTAILASRELHAPIISELKFTALNKVLKETNDPSCIDLLQIDHVPPGLFFDANS